MGLLSAKVFMNKRSGVERTGQHAVTAADADMFVHEDDPVFTTEGRPRRTDIHAGGFLTVLAHQRQRNFPAGGLVLKIHFANPLGIRLGTPHPRQSMLVIARRDTGVASACTATGIDPQAPAMGIGDWFVI